ncbi:MAG: response regulator [Planctomycetaceae bacterium]|jgi:CheY-like chemotaxis protein|nr:response regulator [Planctomycetaceae bacterium]
MTTTKTFEILFVDDNSDFRGTNIDRLAQEGFTVTAAAGAKEAGELIGTKNFDLIITDLEMENPDSGFTLAYHIKKQRPDLPIIIVSSANSKYGLDFSMSSESERRWMKCDALLPKPVRFEQLLSETNRLLGIETVHSYH